MSASELLLEVLDNLEESDFKLFKWYLLDNVLDGCKPLPRHCLEKADRVDTVTLLIKRYGGATAVAISVKVLKKMNHNNAAPELENKYRELGGVTAASSTTGPSAAAAAAAPSTISAENGGLVFAPNVSNTQGSWNVTITHK